MFPKSDRFFSGINDSYHLLIAFVVKDFKHGYSQVFRVFGSRNGHGEDLADDQYYVESEYLVTQ